MKCDECNKNNGHEIWCCLSREAAAPVASRDWAGFNQDGLQVQRGTFPPHVKSEFVLAYMQKRPMFGQVVVRVGVL